MQLQWTCDCKARLVCGGEGAAEWLLQNIMYRHKSKHPHLFSRLHRQTVEYLLEQFIKSLDIRLAFSFLLLYSHLSQVWQWFQHPADFAVHQHATQRQRCDLIPASGHQVLTFLKFFHRLRNGFNSVICCPPWNWFQMEDITSIKISTRVPFFCQLSFEQTNTNVSSENALEKASRR